MSSYIPVAVRSPVTSGSVSLCVGSMLLIKFHRSLNQLSGFVKKVSALLWIICLLFT